MQRKAEKIWNPALFGIRNPVSWNPESSTRNPESTGWNPESRTVMDSLTWGECNVVSLFELPTENKKLPTFEWRGGGRGVDSFVLRS